MKRGERKEKEREYRTNNTSELFGVVRRARLEVDAFLRCPVFVRFYW